MMYAMTVGAYEVGSVISQKTLIFASRRDRIVCFLLLATNILVLPNARGLVDQLD
jgi:hypothetical protein